MATPETTTQCNQCCEDGFIRCTARHPTGCAEALRICREQYDIREDEHISQPRVKPPVQMEHTN